MATDGSKNTPLSILMVSEYVNLEFPIGGDSCYMGEVARIA